VAAVDVKRLASDAVAAPTSSMLIKLRAGAFALLALGSWRRLVRRVVFGRIFFFWLVRHAGGRPLAPVFRHLMTHEIAKAHWALRWGASGREVIDLTLQ
jgi:hypothetical protein